MQFLIVDDDLASREFLLNQLSDRGAGQTAATGVQAIEMFGQALDKGNPYALVVIDSKLADMNGAAVLRALRSVESQRGVAKEESVKIVILNLPWLSAMMIT